MHVFKLYTIPMFMIFNLLKKILVSSLSILGYLGVLIPMTVFTGRWLGKLVDHNNNPRISERNKAAYIQLTICAILVLVSSHSIVARVDKK